MKKILLFMNIVVFLQSSYGNTDKIDTLINQLNFKPAIDTLAQEKGQNPASKINTGFNLKRGLSPSSIMNYDYDSDTVNHFLKQTDLPFQFKPIPIDSLTLQANPFFIDLVFMGYPKTSPLSYKEDFCQLYFGTSTPVVKNKFFVANPTKTPQDIINQLRYYAREDLTCTAADLYLMNYDDLPNPMNVKSGIIRIKPDKEIVIKMSGRDENLTTDKLGIKKIKVTNWSKKLLSQVQFSQNVTSINWYQGSSSMMAVLGVLNGQLIYDNKKNVVFENYGEWRMGFNAVFSDKNAKRAINTNDDAFKINSKIGIRASDNFYYSSSLDFSTQLLQNFQSVSSNVLTAQFLSPARVNLNVGMDMKIKKVVSLMLAPVSFRYIYVMNTTNENPQKGVNPNFFGIPKGKNHLNEIGSRFTAQLTTYSPFQELQINSKLSFYTNYNKVEVDWEIVSNFLINRYLSTRLSINPRYDNTVILPQNEKAKIQFKEFLSFGFSYKLLD